MREKQFEVVRFNHLYDTTWAVFRGRASGGRLREVIFPQDFQPEEGKAYEVELQVTATGLFTWKGEDFRVVRAHLAGAATFGEQIVARFRQCDQVRNAPTESVMAAAFKKAGVGK